MKIRNLLLGFLSAIAFGAVTSASVSLVSNNSVTVGTKADSVLLLGGSFIGSFPNDESWVGNSVGYYKDHGYKFDDNGDTLKSPTLPVGNTSVRVEIKAGYNGGSGSTLKIGAYDASDGELDSAIYTPAQSYKAQTTSNTYDLMSDGGDINYIKITFTKVKNVGMEYFSISSIDTTPSLSITQGAALTFMTGESNQTITATTKNVTNPVFAWTRESGTSASIVSGANEASLVFSIGDASETPTVFKVTADTLSASISVTVVSYGAASISWTDRPATYNEGDIWSLAGTAVATMNDQSTKTLLDSDVQLYVNGSATPATRPYTTTNADTKYAIGFGGAKSTSLSIDLNLLVSNIAMKTTPTKTAYKFGESIDHTGGVLTVKYSNETTADVDLTAEMLTTKTANVIGTQAITVTYKEKTATFDVSVTNKGIVYESTKSITPSDISGGYSSENFDANCGYTMYRANVGNYSTNIQIKASTSYSYYLANKNDLGAISSIKITALANGDKITAFHGTSEKPTTAASVSSDGSVYTFDMSGDHYFKISNSGTYVSIGNIDILVSDASAHSDQAKATRDYIQQYVSCASGWTETNGVNSRTGVAGLAGEYNGLNNATKDALAALSATVADFDNHDSAQYSDGKYVEGGVANVNNVNILEKLKMIVSQYNSTLKTGETKLTLAIPDGDYTGVPAMFIETLAGNESLSIGLAIFLTCSLALGSGLCLVTLKKRKRD